MTHEQKPEIAEFQLIGEQAANFAHWVRDEGDDFHKVFARVRHELRIAEARGAAEQRRKDAEGAYGSWLPIDTAPKDGTTILVPVKHIGADVVLWDLNGWRETTNMLLMRDPPTHWMPIPSFPSAGRPTNVAALEARAKELEGAKGRKQEEARRYRNALANIVAKTGSYSVAHRIALEALAAIREGGEHG